MAVSPEFMAELAGTEDDESRFSELVFGSPLHAGQQRYGASAMADVNFLLPGNSWGKTEYIARKVLHDCWFKVGKYQPDNFQDWITKDYKALIASFDYSTGKESFERLEAYNNNRPEVAALISNIKRTDPPRITLTNGAVIDWGSLDGQGKRVEAARRNVIYVDEVGHIPDISATFDNILFPRTMGVGGRIHLFGTPKATSDPYLLEVFEKGRMGNDPFYYSQEGSVFENEFWPKAEQDRVLENPRYVTGWRPCEDCEAGSCENLSHRDGQKPTMTPIGRQVILGHFVIAGGYFFNRWHIDRIFTGEHTGEFYDSDHYEAEAEDGRLYLGAFDLGGNRARKKGYKGSDATVGMVIDYTDRPWKLVYYRYIRGGDADWQQKYEEMARVYENYGMNYLCIDSTGQTDSVSEALWDRGVDVVGINFGGAASKKWDMLRQTQLCMELEWDGNLGVIRSPLIEGLKNELYHYVWPDDHIVQDRTMALAMCLSEIAQWELPTAVAGEIF